jgi:hypothetical protein
MMDMKQWAENEVDMACYYKNPNKWDDDFYYSWVCYRSALKAFESLLSDGHSGASIIFTKNILIRLIEGKPLTPIEDTEDIWNLVDNRDKEYSTYQCKRMSSLFKYMYNNGDITYSDMDRYICYDIDDLNSSYKFGLANRIIDEMYPIKMPYYPLSKKYEVYCNSFLLDPKNGDYDTIGILYCNTPDNKREYINRYFKDSKQGLEEITEDEYKDRLKKWKEKESV